MQTVLLVNPPIHFSRGVPYTLDTENPPLGLLYLASYLRQESERFAAEVIDVGPEMMTLQELGARIRAERPFAVGIAAMTLQLQGALEVARQVRREAPGAPVFLGGNHVSGDPGFVERHADLFDHGITGEGEKTFHESLERLADGKTVPRLQEGQAVTDLDRLPFPDRAIIDRRRYLRPEYLMVSRGCPFHCTFCSAPALSGKARMRSADNVLEEIRQNLRPSGGRISFQDDNFTLSRDFVRELCEGITRERWRLRWNCSTRIDLVDEETVRRMQQAGCESINFGIESGSERVRSEAMGKKGFDNGKVLAAIDMCRRLGVRPNGFFILGNPTETEEELRETRDLILRSRLSGIAISMPLPFPGSLLWERARREGVVSEEIVDQFARQELGEGCVGVYPLYLAHLDRETVSRAMRDTYRRFYLRASTCLDILARDLLVPAALVQDLKSAFHLLRRGVSCRKPFA